MYLCVGVGVHIYDLLFSVAYFAHTCPRKHMHARYTTAAVGLVRPDSLAAPALYLPQTIRLRRGGCLSVCHGITTHHSEREIGTDVDSENYTGVCVYMCV